MDAQCFTKEKMLNYVCRPDSYFITEGRDLMNQEFHDDSTTYYSILQLIAAGMTRRSIIDGAMQKDTGTYLQNLERNFNMITRLMPLFAKPNSKTTAYEISDPFLRFWFRFIWPYQSLIERQQFALLRKNIGEHYEQFSGRTLEHYFHAKYMESGAFTITGNWWDRKGENEIDLIAVNEFDKTGVIAEIKRNRNRIDMEELERKSMSLPSSFKKFNFKLQALSIEDM